MKKNKFILIISCILYTMQNHSEIDIWGKFKDQKAQALAEYLETEEARKAIQTELVAQIAEGYYNLILLSAQLEVAQTNYDLSENTLKILQLEYEAGEVTALAIQQTKSQMLTAKALIPNLKKTNFFTRKSD